MDCRITVLGLKDVAITDFLFVLSAELIKRGVQITEKSFDGNTPISFDPETGKVIKHTGMIEIYVYTSFADPTPPENLALKVSRALLDSGWKDIVVGYYTDTSTEPIQVAYDGEVY